MAITRLSNSGIATGGVLKYDTALAGYPGVMPAPTAADGGTGSTATVSFSTVTGATGYRAISTPGSFTGTGTTSPITVSGLTTGVAYTFQIQAQNALGYGGLSAASNSVTIAEPNSYESIATITITSDGTSAATFSSIPSTYKHLEFRGFVRAASAVTTGQMNWTLNNDNGSSKYNNIQIYGDGTNNTTISASGNTSTRGRMLYIPGDSYNANVFSAVRLMIMDYTQTTINRSMIYQGGYNTNGSTLSPNPNQWTIAGSSGYASSTAVSTVSFTNDSGGWKSGTTFALYGIKA